MGETIKITREVVEKHMKIFNTDYSMTLLILMNQHRQMVPPNHPPIPSEKKKK